MAVSDPEGRAMNTKGPLTPPSERMELDSEQSHGVSLQNGLTLKEPSLDAPPSVHPSIQEAPVDNIQSYLQNSALPSEGALEASQDISDTSHLPASSEPDLTSTAFTSSAPEDSVERPKSSSEDNSADITSAVDPPSSIVQAPTSDLDEDPEPATSQQMADIMEQTHEQDLIRNPELANGMTSEAPEVIERSSPLATMEQEQVETAPASAVNQMDNLLPTTEPLTVTVTELPHHPPVPIPEGAQPEAPIDPAPSPAAPGEAQSQAPIEQEAPTPIERQSPLPVESRPPPPIAPRSPLTSATEDPSGDQVMQDVAPSPGKVARPREDDDAESEPAMKRTKTDVEGEGSSAPEFKKPDLPDTSTNVNGVQSSHMRADFINPPTSLQYKAMLRVIGNIKRTKDAGSFLVPVDPVALSIPSYPTIVANPMDLGTLEQKFKDHQYPSIAAFVADFNLIVQNCETFNGLAHAVTHSAHKMKASFDKQMERLPGPEVPGHVPADKKKKPSVSTMDKPPPPRRESRSSLPGFARSPVTPASPQTFALTPQGMPLIRRDSAADGRPKREIHPPAPRDLPYANQKPKKKKYLWELRFCEHVLGELKKSRYAPSAIYFLNPVDPVALNIPDYHKIIKKPMDLGTVGQKLSRGEYENAKEFEADVRLIFSNCYKFNPPDHPVHQAGKSVEGVFDSKMADKQHWIENNAPPSGPTSPGSSPEASEEEDEEQEEDEQASYEIRKLQEQIAAMSKQVELITQKKKSPPAPSKKSTKAAAKSDKKPKRAAPAPPPKAKSNAKSVTKKSTRYVSYEEKQDISNRINDLSEPKMAQALNIIRNNMPSLKLDISVSECLSSTSASKDSQGDELELDIDELSNDVLLELHKFVKKHAPRPEDKPEKASPPAYAPVASTGSARKKNKPMGKTEQESKIKQLESTKARFTNPGSVERSIEYPAAPDTSAVQDRDTSGDEEVSEESEEE